MQWNKEAEDAVSKVPFFVRRRVRKRVEEEAARSNAPQVTLEHVNACRKRYMESMDDEVKGYRVESCFSSGTCPNCAVDSRALVAELEGLLSSAGLRRFLKEKVGGPLKMHHEFSVSVSECPNACSRPQIADVGILGAIRPEVSSEPCSGCGACEEICKESAVRLAKTGPDETPYPELDYSKCVLCGQCVRECPTGALTIGETGYRVQLGGKLGRHPQLGRELDGIYAPAQVIEALNACLEHYKKNCDNGERLGETLNRTCREFEKKIRSLDLGQGFSHRGGINSN